MSRIRPPTQIVTPGAHPVSPAAPRAIRRRVPYAVLLLCAAATLAATGFVYAMADRQDRARFQRVAERTRVAVASRMDAYSAALRNITALFQTGGIPDREQFHEYVTRLDLPGHYPGLLGIGFSLRFPTKDRDLWSKTGREHVDPSFRLWPPDPPRALYHMILYLEPLDERKRRVIGFDMHTEPTRAAAMDAARDNAAPTASGKVELLQERADGAKQAGFLIYMPLFKGRDVPKTPGERLDLLVGYIYAPFHPDDLLATVLQNDPGASVDFRLYDGTAEEPPQLLHDSAALRPATAAPAAAPRYTRLERLEMAGRPWTLRFVSRPEFDQGSSRWFAQLIFALGAAVSLALFALSRSQATALAAGRAALVRLQQSQAELRHAKDAAEAANRAKDDFLATLSHELRTPLNAILGWSYLLREGPGEADGLGEGLNVIDRNARAQARLVEDLLDMSRIVTGQVTLDFRPVDLKDVLESAVEAVRPDAAAKGVRLEAAPSAPGNAVRGDPGRLQQVLWNLLSNAIKFTPPGGSVRASVERVNDRVQVVVADTGVGIRPEFLPHVFDRFRQADASFTRTHGGLGLGLAIVKHLVELHGGTATAQSAGEGRGATFTVSLPHSGLVARNDTGRTEVHDAVAEDPGECPSGAGAI